MLENISSMFRSNDPDSQQEPDEPIDADDGMGEEPFPGSEMDPSADDQGATDAAAPPDHEEADAETDVDELDTRIDELDDELSSTQASLRELQSSQAEMTDSVDEMNETVRQLVGVYDRLAAAENPFVDDPNGTGADAGPPIPGADDATGSSSPASATDNHGAASDGTPTPESTDDDVVSFDDLQLPSEESPERNHPVGDPAVAAETERGRADEGAAPTRSVDDDGPVLDSIPDGYAGEVLVMEWLATLMERSGPAGAFRAVDYYESVGWISPSVEERLVDVIGGPALDVFVDPTQPREPTAEEHAVSHEYLRVMARLNEI